MICKLCGKRIWFWQDSTEVANPEDVENTFIYHMDCYEQDISKQKELAKKKESRKSKAHSKKMQEEGEKIRQEVIDNLDSLKVEEKIERKQEEVKKDE